MLKNLYTKITGDPNEKEIQRSLPVVEEINALEPALQKLSDAELRAKTDAFRARLADALVEPRRKVQEMRAQLDTAADAEDRRMIEEHLKQAQTDLTKTERDTLDEILPEAFACVREVSVRVNSQRHFDVQMIGGIVLHEGKVAEMKTGEGKTLVATLPLYLNALLGHGAHLVTVNDYLARYHTQIMGPIYHFLGLSVATLQQGEKNALMFDPTFESTQLELNHLRASTRQEAYRADITYGTNNEFGFDYLRDNMAWRLEERVQRELYYAIVDEVDNILIDEARTPLIISGPAGEASEEYYRLAEIVRKLGPDDYTIEQRTRSITLTEPGYDRVEELLGASLTNPDRPEEADPQQAKLMHHLEAALKAEYLFKRDKDYIVSKGQVIIVDEFTGRLMPGRRWSDGLHQAVEAKERAPIQQESITYATITLQNYFRLYQRLAGMTGTAKTEEDEFQKVYGLDVVVIPTNKKMIRADHDDLVYRNEEAKWRAVTIEIVGLYARGQPTLLGTTSIENSERLSKRLTAPKLQSLARLRLLTNALDANTSLSDKQRSALKLFLGRSLDDPNEMIEEAYASRWFHDHDLRAIMNATRKLNKDVREVSRIKTNVTGKSGKSRADAAKRFNLRESDLRELENVDERDLKFAARLEERGLHLDVAETLCSEIAAHPDDLAKIAPKFGLPIDMVMQVYQDLRLSRSELIEIIRALIESLGDVEGVRSEFRVRSSDMEAIVRRLYLRDDDITRLAKKLGVNVDPFAEENAQPLNEIFDVDDPPRLGEILRSGAPHSVLNAKEHEKEAGIIARAGEIGAITLATNMAGRGVDIKLGGELSEETLTQVGRVLHRAGIDPYNMSFDEIALALEKIPPETYALDAESVERFKKHMHDRVRTRELGGLRVVGTERHEARRIDNQLRGRSGRQGDAGSSRFYVSIEDEIMRRMGGKGLMDRVWVEDIPIQHGWVTNAIEQAQIKMEGYNFDIRKHLLEYDDVLNKQREVIYGQRHRILTKADLRDDLRGWIEEELRQILETELKSGDQAHSRLLSHLDTMLPGFWFNPEELSAPYSLSLVQRELASDGRVATTSSILSEAKRALELSRDFLIQSVVPEVIGQLEQQYKPGWDEVEEVAKNTLTTIRQEAAEQNRHVDMRTAVPLTSQAVGLPISLRSEKGAEIGDQDILDAVHRAFDARMVDQAHRRAAKRANLGFEFHWNPDSELDFGALREALTHAVEDAYTKQAERHLADIERELGERVKTDEDLRGARLSHLLFLLSHTRQTAFDQRTHQRIEFLVPRFSWAYLAATKIENRDETELRQEILDYWLQSLAQLENARGGVAPFNDLTRELMLSVVTSQWVDYLTAIEDLRTGIGLQAFGQRDPLVEYKRRAYAMFQDLLGRIRSQVVMYIFTYQYRGLARLEEEKRELESRQIPAISGDKVQITRPKPMVKAQPAAPSREPAQAMPRSAPAPVKGPTAARPGVTTRPTDVGSIGRNDPCWCGSGKKYKHCHMQSDMR
jgi:preprotein translocase subunit SecA